MTTGSNLCLFYLLCYLLHVWYFRSKSSGCKVKMLGEPMETKGSKKYYREMMVGEDKIWVGCFVAVKDEDKPDLDDIGRVQYIWETSPGDAHLHVHWFWLVFHLTFS